jgi:hypothetical protein
MKTFLKLYATLVSVLCAATPATPLHAQTTPAAVTARAPQTYWLIVTGLSGEPDIAITYNGWAEQIARAAHERFGASRVLTLSEAAPDSAAMSTKANIERQLTDIAAHATGEDALFIVLIGHGSASENVARIALPGPDLTATDLAKILGTMPARVTVINTASTSGAWLAPLAAKGRVVVTSTRSGVEQNETTFAGYFAAALSSDGADTDKDNRVSVLEAFNYAKREVERAYSADKRMLTEHAQIDGDGDGKAVAAATTESPDGAVASLTFFSTGSASPKASTAAQTPELRALYAEKTRLEQQLASLRTRKAEMPDAEYQKLLEALLLDIAKNGQAIRKLEGGK